MGQVTSGSGAKSSDAWREQAQRVEEPNTLHSLRLFSMRQRDLVTLLVEWFRVLLAPVAHIALDGHGIIRCDIVTHNIVEGAGGALQFGIRLLDEQGDNLLLVFAFVHGAQYKVAPAIEAFAQAGDVRSNIRSCAVVGEVEYVGP